jgi:hypothetical protein
MQYEAVSLSYDIIADTHCVNLYNSSLSIGRESVDEGEGKIC